MKVLIQRVNSANCVIDGKVKSEISKGLLVYLGFSSEDDGSEIDWLINKILNLRIFEKSGKLNLSVKDVEGEILIISQFTLYANTNKGRRPDFTQAAKPEIAQKLYDKFLQKLYLQELRTQSGVFGASMEIHSINDGPINIVIER